MTWQEKIASHPYLVLAFSIAAEVTGTTCMKMSEGFTVLSYAIIYIIAFALSLSGLVIVLNNASTLIGIVLVIGGIILLNRGQNKEA